MYPARVRGSRPAVVVLGVALVLAASATALGSGGYRIRDASWHRPPTGSLYSVNVHGVAARKALVYLYLDEKPCRWTWASEARNNVTSFKTGQSFFKDTRKALVTLWVNGRFNTSFTARAGTTPEPEYACAYLTTPNSNGSYRLTASHASNAYFVTG
jgi:hypothetical protein